MGQDYSIESPAQRQHEAVIVPLSVVMKPLQLYLILAVGFVFSSKGDAIKCNYCQSRVSYEDCDKNIKYVECGEEFGLDRCAKTHIKPSSKREARYERGCQTAARCKQPACKVYGYDVCEVYCCTKDYCNKSSLPIVSVTLLFTSSVLAFFTKLVG